MLCPNCGDKMLVEHCPVTRSSTFEEYKVDHKEARLVPAAHYRCEGCDSEWAWIKGVKGILFIDGAIEPRGYPKWMGVY